MGWPSEAASLRVSVFHWREWAQVAPVWAQLELGAPRSSFFLTCPWVETWLEVFGTQLRPAILVFESSDGPVAACLIAAAKRSSPFVPIRRLALNTAGESADDTTYTEFNDLLCLEGWESAVAKALYDHLRPQRWDELRLDGFTPGPVYDAMKDAFRMLNLAQTARPSYHVDLAGIRHSGLAYEMTLGSKNRKHLRQNIRYHSELGPLRVEIARSAGDALLKLDELAKLSQQRWAARNRKSIFSSVRFREFHRRLITRCLDSGGVQLIRVVAGEHTVGVVYNLVHRGKIYFYQCGYRYGADKRLSPGVVTLSQVIQHSLDSGYDDYDFLAGADNYKQWLATGSRTLVWAAFRRPGLKLQLWDGIRRIRTDWLKRGASRRVGAASESLVESQ
jgi:hypothetical protein